MSHQTGYLLALLTVFVWGFVVLPARSARTGGLPGVGISIPCGIVALLLAALVSGSRVPSLGSLVSPAGLFLLLGGICQFPLATFLYYECLRCDEVSRVVPFTRLKSVIVLLIVIPLGLEKITTGVVAACACAIVGACVLSSDRKTRAAKPAAHATRGMWLAFFTSLSWALGDVFIRLAVDSFSPLVTTLVALVLGGVTYYSLMALSGRLKDIYRMPARDKGLYAIHGVFSFGVGYFAFFAAIGSIGVARASVITSAWPGVAFLVGLTFLKEPLTRRKLCGFCLLMGSVWLATV